MAKELVSLATVRESFQAASRLPIVRQLGLLVGLAASVAIGVAAVLWSQEPQYGLLYPDLSEKDQVAIVAELRKADIPYKLDAGPGGVRVPEERIHEARLKLAAVGLPAGTRSGFELMEEGPSFGTSQLAETARYQRALEGELARTVTSMSNVLAARVHLALPRPSPFARTREPPSASVMVSLHGGRTLDEEQVAAIVHLVASSVPNLDPARVTVVDHKGRLLSSSGRKQGFQLTASQFEYARKLEESYVRRIEDILAPIVGPGGVRAQVALDVDFSVTEQTAETFEPDPTAIRSEQVAEEQTRPGEEASGIPGALSNQPPRLAAAPEKAASAAPGPPEPAKPEPNVRRRATRNYELDRTISHTRAAPGRISRLSVAVLVDHKQVRNQNGETTRVPLAPDELDRIVLLVKDAVGFRAERGDSVQVLNEPFSRLPEPEPPPAPSWFEQPWVWQAGKQVLATLVVLLLLFGVLRPLLRGLAARASEAPPVAAPTPAALTGADGYEAQLSTARQIAAQDPRRVAQVVKNWVASDG